MTELTSNALLKHTKPFDVFLRESLKDRAQAKAYLQVALEEYQQDGDREFLLMALRNLQH